MPKKCMVSDKKPMFANSICFSNKKHHRRQEPNLQWKRFWVPEIGRFVRLRVTARVIKLATTVGLLAALKRHGKCLKDVI
jgi:large subunit ribosomal protein L28